MLKKRQTTMVGPMRVLSDFPPVTGVFAGPTWVCGPVSFHGHANAMDKANYDVMMEELDEADPYGLDYQTVKFGHFATGFVQMVFARPGSKAVQALGLIRDRLEREAVLDTNRLANYSSGK